MACAAKECLCADCVQSSSNDWERCNDVYRIISPTRKSPRMTLRTLALTDLTDTVAERFIDGNGVIWTGAGVSARPRDFDDASAAWNVGLPSADALRRHLARRLVPAPSQQDGLAEVSQRYEQQFGRERLNKVIALYQARHATPPQFYDRVAQLPAEIDTFVTTNYDPFLYAALARARDPIKIVRGHALHTADRSRPVVYMVHGDAADPSRCVVTTEDYVRWEADTGVLRSLILNLFLQRTVIAIGYRIRDQHFHKLLSKVGDEVRGSGGTPHPLYVVDPKATEADFAAYIAPHYNLFLVPVSGTDFLGWLTARIGKVRRARAAAVLEGSVDQPRVAAARAALHAIPREPITDGTANPAVAAAVARRRAQAHEALSNALSRRADGGKDSWSELVRFATIGMVVRLVARTTCSR